MLVAPVTVEGEQEKRPRLFGITGLTLTKSLTISLSGLGAEGAPKNNTGNISSQKSLMASAIISVQRLKKYDGQKANADTADTDSNVCM